MEIIELTEQDIVEYAQQYDASLLNPGMRVLYDEELYMTADEIEYEIAKISEALKLYSLTNADERKERLDMLTAALQNLRQII